LAQLKELEDLRVQLSLPGADPIAASAEGAAVGESPAVERPPGAGDAAATHETDASLVGVVSHDAGISSDADDDEETEAADATQHRVHGLVARGAADDQH
jgi:hypothetical protein